MARKANEIVQAWRKRVDPEVSKDDVETVVRAYFPTSYRFSSSSGSHWIIIEDDELRTAQEMGFAAGLQDGTMSISLTRGKFVKKWQIDKLLKAIKIKEELEKIKNQEAQK